jgi:hypothetical protein
VANYSFKSITIQTDDCSLSLLTTSITPSELLSSLIAGDCSQLSLSQPTATVAAIIGPTLQLPTAAKNTVDLPLPSINIVTSHPVQPININPVDLPLPLINKTAINLPLTSINKKPSSASPSVIAISSINRPHRSAIAIDCCHLIERCHLIDHPH